MLLKNSYNNTKNIIFKNACLVPGAKILDVGCGRRGNVYGIDPKAYTGIDSHFGGINRHKGDFTGRYYPMDAQKLSFDALFFDCVISVSLLHHLSAVELKNMMMEIKRVLKEDGKIIIADGVYPERKANILGWLIRFLDRGRYVRTKYELKSLLSRYFCIEKEYYFVDKIFAYSIFVMGCKN